MIPENPRDQITLNVFRPASTEDIQGGLDGRLYQFGEYQGVKFIVDDDNEADLNMQVEHMLDDIALKVCTKV